MPSGKHRSEHDHRYNTSEKGKARQKRYAKTDKRRTSHRRVMKRDYEKKKAAGICVKTGCREPADAGVYCADHLRYVIEASADRTFSKGGG